MKLLKQRIRSEAKASVILVDWSVRESFHVLHYLKGQDLSRESFEVIVIEYYSRRSEALLRFEDEVDVWVLLEMPERCHYHKHLMYNAGIALARGKICVLCDSDAMVRPSFVRSILQTFDGDARIVLHLDQFRNVRKDLYPFDYPSFDEVMGEGCANRVGERTRGLSDAEDPLHTRNYGACLAARRSDLLRVGGADEHIDYLGHVCGPYDMTFRLMNAGCTHAWHETEFMYHTWHPGQAGEGNFAGPDDGRLLSTRALEALVSGRVKPVDPNELIARMAAGESITPEQVCTALIASRRYSEWDKEVVARCKRIRNEPPRLGKISPPVYVAAFVGVIALWASQVVRYLPELYRHLRRGVER